MREPERLGVRDEIIGFVSALALVVVGVLVLDGTWAVAVAAVGVSLWLEALLRLWRRRRG